MNLKDIKVFIDQTQRTVQRALDRLTLSREDIRLQMRAARMQNLISRGGTATSEELFIADFGTRNPNGLDVTYPDHDQIVVPFDDLPDFQELSEKEQAFFKKRARGLGGQGGIGINPSLLKDSGWKSASRELSSTMAHEHIHCLQSADQDNGWESTFTSRHTSLAMRPLVDTSFWGKAKRLYQKAYQHIHETSHQIESGRLSKVFKSASADKYSYKNYFAEDYEMQARLHQVLGQGYAVWQKMPTTKVELWAALHNCGLRTPPSVNAILQESEEGRQALKRFAISPITQMTLSYDKVKELNEVFNHAALNECRDMMWQHVYPHLYGNLLELYGDRLGRERMGLGTNPRKAKEIMKRFLYEPDSLTEQTLPVLTEELDPESATKLLSKLAQNNENSEVHQSKAIEITKHLLQKPEVRDYLNNMPHQTGMEITEHPLLVAVKEGNREMVNTLLDAGIDPLGRYTLEHVSQPGITQTWSIASLLEFQNYLSRKYIMLEGNPGRNQLIGNHLLRLKDGLQALAEHTDKLDIKMPASDDSDNIKTLKEELYLAGFSSERNKPSVRSNTANFSTL